MYSCYLNPETDIQIDIVLLKFEYARFSKIWIILSFITTKHNNVYIVFSYVTANGDRENVF